MPRTETGTRRWKHASARATFRLMQTPLGRLTGAAATPAAAASAAIGPACRADLLRDLGVRRTGADLAVLFSSPPADHQTPPEMTFSPSPGARALPDSQRNIMPLSLRKYNLAIFHAAASALYIYNNNKIIFM